MKIKSIFFQDLSEQEASVNSQDSYVLEGSGAIIS
jgi:hypothetical protein